MQKRQWLEDIRKSKGMTHQEVADQIGVSRQYYGFIENGKGLSVDVAKKLGNLFDFDWTIFFEDESYKSLHNKNSA